MANIVTFGFLASTEPNIASLGFLGSSTPPPPPSPSTNVPGPSDGRMPLDAEEARRKRQYWDEYAIRLLLLDA